MTENIASTRSPAGRTRVALLGFGTALTDIINRNAARKRTSPQGQALSSAIVWHDNPEAVFTEPDVDVVIETIGGFDPAENWIRAALTSGKSVVTASGNSAGSAGRSHHAARRHRERYL